MKLYLMSVGPPSQKELFELIGSNTDLSVVLIPNAWDEDPKGRKEAALKKCSNDFKSLGFSISVLDLKTSNKQTVQQSLEGKSMVWVMGGNTFYLNFYMHKSEFKEVLKPLLGRGFVYGGESAGAVVTGITLHGIEYLDDPKTAPEVIWDGLKFLNYSIIPHWESDKYSHLLTMAKDEMERFSKIVTLTDKQALIVDGEEAMFVEKDNASG